MTLEAAAGVLRDARSIALACHVGPDGDALGSMLGLALAARNAGKEAISSFGSPYIVPPSLRFLPTDLLVAPASFPERPEVMVVLDVGSADRVGELAANARDAGTVIVIDHHVTNDGFGDVAVVDPTAAATGELVYDLLGLLGWKVDAQIAQCLLTALITDTGRFQYSNTTPRTLQIAAELVSSGADPSVVGRHVYEEAPFGYLKAAGVAMGRATLDEEKGVVTTTITHEDLEEIGISWADTENLIDLLRLALEADTAVLLKGQGDGTVKVSMRSRGATDVGGLAAALGGGGHRLAAGLTATGTVDEVRARILGMVEDYR